MRSIPEQDADDYVSYSDKIKRLTYADLECDDVDVEVLDQRSREVLSRNGISELFPV